MQIKGKGSKVDESTTFLVAGCMATVVRFLVVVGCRSARCATARTPGPTSVGAVGGATQDPGGRIQGCALVGGMV